MKPDIRPDTGYKKRPDIRYKPISNGIIGVPSKAFEYLIPPLIAVYHNHINGSTNRITSHLHYSLLLTSSSFSGTRTQDVPSDGCCCCLPCLVVVDLLLLPLLPSSLMLLASALTQGKYFTRI